MTTLYRPVLIQSAEQAEALPDGTIATRDRDWPRILLRDETGHHWASGGMAGFMYPVDMTGWTALVPIEAEEEWEDDGRPVWNLGEGEATPADVDDYERRNGRRPSRRLVTPWEEA